MLDKSFGVGQPRRLVKPRILIANTPMDTDKIKIYGSRVRFYIINEHTSECVVVCAYLVLYMRSLLFRMRNSPFMRVK